MIRRDGKLLLIGDFNCKRVNWRGMEAQETFKFPVWHSYWRCSITCMSGNPFVVARGLAGRQRGLMGGGSLVVVESLLRCVRGGGTERESRIISLLASSLRITQGWPVTCLPSGAS
ncbi:hypothetical protein E2C01_018088 [Portunus trituberculatus]|uniref:Endonuclease/exonuclease/phosphatase domain-containing protein n=1 Tax=Portunus trituberculatus TaxID=210409 RepID=A0A5B7DTL5_PORTR|nr:hypothetical protein [Portunus trituberculatus]